MNALKVLRFAVDGIAVIANTQNGQIKHLLDDFAAYAYESEFERIMYFSATDLYVALELDALHIQLLVNSWTGKTYTQCNISVELSEALVSESGVALILTEQDVDESIWLEHLYAENMAELNEALTKIEQAAQLKQKSIQAYILRFLTDEDKQQFLAEFGKSE